MKTANNFNKIIRRIATPAVFSTLFLVLLVTGDVQANDATKKEPIEIKYIGSVNQNPVFQIDFENPEGEEVYLSLKDENGVLIYSDVVKDKKYSRKLQLNTGDINDLKMVLSLRSKKGVETQTFQINKNVRVIENVEVARL